MILLAVTEYKDLVGFSKELVDYEILFAYAIFGVTLISALVFAALPLFRDFKKAIPALVALVGAAALYFLCYFMASGDPLTITTGTGDETYAEGVMKFVEANMFMTYIVFGFSILALIYTSISSYFK